MRSRDIYVPVVSFRDSGLLGRASRLTSGHRMGEACTEPLHDTTAARREKKMVERMVDIGVREGERLGREEEAEGQGEWREIYIKREGERGRESVCA